jgi:hypothetical protein
MPKKLDSKIGEKATEWQLRNAGEKRKRQNVK